MPRISVGGSAVDVSALVGRAGGAAPLGADSGRLPVRNDPHGTRVGVWFPGYPFVAAGAKTTTATLAQIETDLSAKFDYVLLFQGLAPSQTYKATDWAEVSTWLDAGREVVLNLELAGSHAQINSGAFDAAVDSLVGFVTAYAQANPGWKDSLSVKLLHEGNLTTGYQWCVYTTTNLAAAGGSVATSAANYVTAFQRIAARYRNAVDSKGRRLIRTIFEVGNANNAADPAPLDIFYPGSAAVDIVSVNNYNRYNLLSGAGYWGRFGDMVRPTLDAFRRIAPDKPIMIGESSTSPGGYVGSVQITAGGTGYAAGTTATITDPAGHGTGATVSLTITGGVITGVTMTNQGQDYNFVTPPTVTLSNTGGGTGATLTALVYGSKFNKADWFREAFEFVRDNSDITYLTWFFQNVDGGVGDMRLWAPNTPTERQGWTEGYGLLNRRAKLAAPSVARVNVGANLCSDPYTNDVTKWDSAGANKGTVSKSASLDNLPGDSDPRMQTTSGAISGNLSGAIRLSHNGTVGAPADNRLRFALNGKLINPNQQVTISFDARAKRLAGSGSMHLLPTLEIANPSNVVARYAPIRLTRSYQRYQVTVSSGDTNGAANGWLIAFCIGSSDMNGELQLTNVKVEWGGTATPLLPGQRQITRTTVADAAYSYGTTGTTDELLAYTSLTAARQVTLPDAKLVVANRVIAIKDEAGTAATNNLTIATTASQTIDGAATKVINTAYGFVRLYSNGTNWFTC